MLILFSRSYLLSTKLKMNHKNKKKLFSFVLNGFERFLMQTASGNNKHDKLDTLINSWASLETCFCLNRIVRPEVFWVATSKFFPNLKVCPCPETL